jgi:hypothetical protein
MPTANYQMRFDNSMTNQTQKLFAVIGLADTGCWYGTQHYTDIR